MANSTEERIRELEKELEKLKEEKLDDSTESKEVEEIQQKAEEDGFSRRKFLKMLGGGTAAAGAAALLPGTTGFSINSDNGLKYFNQSSQQSSFEVDPQGTLDVNQIGSQTNPVTQAHLKSLNTNVLYNEADADRRVYVESGSGDYVAVGQTGEVDRYPDSGVDAIQAAIDDLPNRGGHVHVEAGEYPITDPALNDISITIDKDDVMLTGDGKATRIFLPDNTTEPDNGKKIIEIGGFTDNPRFNSATEINGCTIKDLFVDGNYQNQGNISNANDGHNIEIHGSDNLVENVWSWNSTGDGVEVTDYGVEGNERNRIVDCDLKDNFEQNVHLHGAQNSLVDGCILHGEQNNGNLSIVAKGSSQRNVNVIVSNCIIVDGNQAGIETNQGNGDNFNVDVLFTGCLVKNNRRGVLINVDDVTSLRFKQCDFINNDLSGLTFGGGVSDTEIVGCTIARNGTHGIAASTSANDIQSLYIKNCTIKDNNTVDGGNHGIHIKNVSGAIDDLTIQNTDIVSTGTPHHRDGIFFDDRGGGAVTNSYVTGGRIYGVKRSFIGNQLGITTHGVEQGGSVIDTPDRVIVNENLILNNINREKRTSQLNLDDGDPMVNSVDMSGNDVSLPAASDRSGLQFVIGSRDSGTFDIIDDSGSTLVTLDTADVAMCFSDGAGWIVIESSGSVT